MIKVIVILGPTAVGKTKMSIELAKRLNGEIINADSTQIFKELDIATAKVTENEMDGIIHHLIDIKNIEEDYSVFDYQVDARKTIEYIAKKGKTPIMVGGTGLYIKAALYDYEFSETVEKNNFPTLTDEELYNCLLKVDPNTSIHQNNRKRVVNAYNYYLNNQKPYSNKKTTDELLYDVIFIGLTTERELLYSKINSRVDKMIEQGLLEEASKIYKKNIKSKAVMTPIGYKELFDYFDNKISLDEALDIIKQRSRKYAKRQFTWFNNQMKVTWFNVDYNEFENTINDVLKFIKGMK